MKRKRKTQQYLTFIRYQCQKFFEEVGWQFIWKEVGRLETCVEVVLV